MEGFAAAIADNTRAIIQVQTTDILILYETEDLQSRLKFWFICSFFY
jgi:hypothetical protein